MTEVLVSTVHLQNTDLPEKMNLQTDAIIVNQTDTHSYRQWHHRGHRIRCYSFAERGVGLSRNTALMRSEGDICILADDDMVFRDGYCAMVRRWFEKHPSADVIIFNLLEKNPVRRVNLRVKRIHRFNYFHYGAARIAFRRSPVSYRGIFFNQNFGGGTPHRCGEDTLFLRDCLAAGLKIIAVPEAIAFLSDDRPSTWFRGYDSRYLTDKGIVLALAHPLLAPLLCLYLALRHREYAAGAGSRRKAFALMCHGIRLVRKKTLFRREETA